ncbi:hypothetical protein BGZ65_004478 [Modicella reniformis]|uniref:Uncharacterized protein n=1 Tax=Modicella reniformis TaxID=1440133 RepID=A0A9P6LUC5_9FUNG|nr:hypothetical protein BGZ65_004478 [Modicella reniformis]
MYISKLKYSAIGTLSLLISITALTLVHSQNIATPNSLDNSLVTASNTDLTNVDDVIISHALREKRDALEGLSPVALGTLGKSLSPFSPSEKPAPAPEAPQPAPPPPPAPSSPAPALAHPAAPQPTPAPAGSKPPAPEGGTPDLIGSILNPGSGNGRGDDKGDKVINDPSTSTSLYGTSSSPSSSSSTTSSPSSTSSSSSNEEAAKKKPTDGTNGTKPSSDGTGKKGNGGSTVSALGETRDSTTTSGNNETQLGAGKGALSGGVIAMIIAVFWAIVLAIGFSCYRIRQSMLRRKRRESWDEEIHKNHLGAGLATGPGPDPSTRTSVGAGIGGPRPPTITGSGSAAASIVGAPGVIGGFAGATEYGRGGSMEGPYMSYRATTAATPMILPSHPNSHPHPLPTSTVAGAPLRPISHVSDPWGRNLYQ